MHRLWGGENTEFWAFNTFIAEPSDLGEQRDLAFEPDEARLGIQGPELLQVRLVPFPVTPGNINLYGRLLGDQERQGGLGDACRGADEDGDLGGRRLGNARV